MSNSLKLIAVTGTSGKTTTAWLAASVLAEAGRRVGVLSDLGCLDAESALPERAPYEEPAALAAWLERLAADGCTHAVVEVSSRMLARQSLAAGSAAIVAVPNIATAHLGLHGTATAYRAVKGRILDALAPGGCLVTGTPSPSLDRLRRQEIDPTGLLQQRRRFEVWSTITHRMGRQTHGIARRRDLRDPGGGIEFRQRQHAPDRVGLFLEGLVGVSNLQAALR